MAGSSGVPLIRYDLAHYGVVTAVISPTVFQIAGLAGFGDGNFTGVTPYGAFVLRKATGTGAAPQSEVQNITAYVSQTGQFTIALAYTVPIVVGDEMLICHPSLANALAIPLSVAALTAIANAIKVQTDKTAGLATVANAVIANWQAAEQNLVIIGANGVSNKLHLVLVSIANLIGNISIRAYHRVNGVERRIFPIPANTTFTAAASAPAIPIWDTTGAITEALRITVQSDNIADNGQAVEYEYKLEAM